MIQQISTNEAIQQFPFLSDLRLEHTTYNPVVVELSEMDNEFLYQSLKENESEALGHEHLQQTLYVIHSDNSLHPVDVKRSSTKIYPPEYLCLGSDFPPDEYGWSETIREALTREDLTGVRYILLHKKGDHGAWYRTKIKTLNNLTIALVKGELKR